MRWAFKLAYWGGGFHGFQRQPDVPTVEGDLLHALRTAGVFRNPKEARLEAASRTDAGVSALGNVVALDTTWDPRRVIATVNPRLRGIWLHGYANPGARFRPREALERWYRYHFPRPLDCERLEAGGRLFLGTHDFGAFAKGAGGRCEIRSVTCEPSGAWTLLDVRGDRFLWNMVRRIAGSLEAYATGRLTQEDLARALEGERGPGPPSPPEGLVLMDVVYAFPFHPFLRASENALREREFRRRMEVVFLRSLRDTGPGGDSQESGPGAEALRASLYPGAND